MALPMWEELVGMARQMLIVALCGALQWPYPITLDGTKVLVLSLMTRTCK